MAVAATVLPFSVPLVGFYFPNRRAGEFATFALTHHSESGRHRLNRHGALHVDSFTGAQSPTTRSVTAVRRAEQGVPAGCNCGCQVHSLVVAAVSVIGTSNYFAYMIGRKQVTAEELRRQIDLMVQLIDRKRVEDDRAPTTVKQRPERLEQNAPGLTGLTTSRINGKTTVVVPEPAPMAAALTDDTSVARPDSEVRSQAPKSSLNTTAKHQRYQGVSHRRRRKVSPSARPGPTEPATTEQSVTRDASVAGQSFGGVARAYFRSALIAKPNTATRRAVRCCHT